MYFDSDQLIVSILTVFFASAIAAVLVFQRDRARKPTRAWGSLLLGACAVIALWSWVRFGAFHTIHVDAAGEQASAPNRRKVERHVPFHFHEFFHYYLGAKYFREVGYEGIYDCAALADKEIAEQDGVRPRINGYIRDLDDVLRDKPYDAALAHCRDQLVPRMAPGRWDAFKRDIRELRRLVPDDYWSGVVVDAGFNPPPSWVLVGGAAASAIPIRVAGAPSYLVATGLDVLLLGACFVALRRAFGAPIAATAAVYFGATFIASYAWNGGAFLRYTWLTTLIFGLAATRHGRWGLAGALLAASTCDRLFPAGFAVGAAVPLAFGALRSPDDRRKLVRFCVGFAGTAAALFVISTLVFGFDAWRVFFQRIVRHGDVYYVMHIGLKKVLTWRDWVPQQNFHGHPGMKAFHDWNIRLRETAASMRSVSIPLQLAATGGAVYAGLRRKPYESALLFGVVSMFFFNIPANYYYVVLVLVPALVLRAAMTAPALGKRLREFAVLAAFNAFWITSLIAPRMSGDDIVYDHTICVALLLFLGFWVLVWLEHPDRIRLRFHPRAATANVAVLHAHAASSAGPRNVGVL